MRFQVRVDGHKELRRAIRQTKDKGLAKELKEAHKQTAAVVVPGAQALAPRRSGDLASTVKPASSVKGAIVRAGSSKGRTKFYAGPIHFGWPARKIKPRAFLFKAAYQKRAEYAQRFKELMSALLRKNIGS